MSAQVDIELGELPTSDQNPSETTKINPDGSERYVNITQRLILIKEIISIVKGFVNIQQNFAKFIVLQ